MKKKFNNKITLLQFILVFFLLVFVSCDFKKPEEISKFELTNILHDLWDKDNPELAVETALRLNNVSQSFFVSRVHNTLIQNLKRSKGKENVSNFINELYNRNVSKMNAIIEPVYLWNTSYTITNDNEANMLLNLYHSKLADTTNYNSKAELAGLLLLKEFEEKKIGNVDIKNKLLRKITTNLSINQLVNKSEEKERDKQEKRGHYRFLFAYSNYQLYKKTDSIIFLKNASKYTPDETDLQVSHSFFYDAHLLVNGPNNINFKQEYVNYLKENNKKGDALNLLLEQFYNIPNNKNRNELRRLYNSIHEEQTFTFFWYDYLNSRMKDAPKVTIDYKNDILNFNKKRKYWVFVDVWGTWCTPCLRELPEINKVSKMYNEDKNSKIKFYSFSYQSNNLQNFMNDNNYTFPVAEVNTKIIKLFEISSYPTKLLISPDNKYLKIPFNRNWKNYIKNYTLSN